MTREHGASHLYTTLLAVPLWAAALSSQPAAAQAPPYPGCESLGTSVQQHACFHAQSGPFVTLPMPLAPQTNLDAVHTHYTVTLSNGGGSVSYRPARSGWWAIFRSHPLRVGILDPQGAAVPGQLRALTSGCAQLAEVELYALQANVRYQLTLGDGTGDSVGLVLERIGDFESTYFRDADGDAFGGDDSLLTACVPPPSFIVADGDCDDADPSVSPSAVELPDGRDNNCNGFTDEGAGGSDTRLYYLDEDGDGYGNPDTALEATTLPDGYVEDGQDCNDLRTDIHPGVIELCDNLDNNCDGQADEGVARPEATTDPAPRYVDLDGDGHGNPGWVITGCPGTLAGAPADDDCDDNDPRLHPSAEELCDGSDNNCDGSVDEACTDDQCATTASACDGRDNDCDGAVDEPELIEVRASARATYNPKVYSDAVLDFPSPAELTLPDVISLTRGCLCRQQAVLEWTEGRKHGRCTYRGLDDRFTQPRCSRGYAPGQHVQATHVSLHIDGSQSCGVTEAELAVVTMSCG